MLKLNITIYVDFKIKLLITNKGKRTKRTKGGVSLLHSALRTPQTLDPHLSHLPHTLEKSS